MTTPTDSKGLARRSDPETSHLAAVNVKMRWNAQRSKLLRVFARENRAMNWEEATLKTDILDLSPRACPWHRVGDLQRDGLLDFTMLGGHHVQRRASSGELQNLYHINDAGRKVVREWDRGE